MMGKVITVMLVFGLLAMMLPLITLGSQALVGASEEAMAQAEQEVTFPDPNLEEAIREVIGRPEGAIYTTDLKRLTGLDANHKHIVDLTGLEHCINLTKLHLDSNYEISDLSPLAGLTNLIVLHLRDNQISDISPLANLTKLMRLYLQGNQISDITPLANLTKLTKLHLEWNQISDLKPLVDNIGLSEGNKVDLRGNPLSDISTKVYIPQLEKRGVKVYF